jgi:hypothetical protein
LRTALPCEWRLCFCWLEDKGKPGTKDNARFIALCNPFI